MYGFEFTVTSHERLTGTVAMFGRYLGKIELQTYPVSLDTESQPVSVVVETHQPSPKANNTVVELRHWQSSKKSDSEQ